MMTKCMISLATLIQRVARNKINNKEMKNSFKMFSSSINTNEGRISELEGGYQSENKKKHWKTSNEVIYM